MVIAIFHIAYKWFQLYLLWLSILYCFCQWILRQLATNQFQTLKIFFFFLWGRIKSAEVVQHDCIKSGTFTMVSSVWSHISFVHTFCNWIALTLCGALLQQHFPIWLAGNEQRYCPAWFLQRHANGTIWQLASRGRRDGLVSLDVSVGIWRREENYRLALLQLAGREQKKRHHAIFHPLERAKCRLFGGIVLVQLFWVAYGFATKLDPWTSFPPIKKT